MQFEDIIGQHRTKQLLKAMINNNHLPHAQLLIGPPGCGSLALALAFAQFVICPHRSAEDSCGSCPHCLKAAKWIHPDIHYSFPTVGSKVTSNQFLEHWRAALRESPYLNINQWMQQIGAENKQGNINKDECVSIIQKLSLKTFEASHKILIMWLPEYLGKEGNRLLKLIEEPPENTLFLLVSENADLILNTILSRCQIIKVSRLSDEEVAAGLMKKNNIPESQALSIAQMADGNFYEACQLEQQQENNQAEGFLDWFRKTYKGKGLDLVNWVEAFAATGRENHKHFIQYALHFFREFLIMKISQQPAARLDSNAQQAARKLINLVSINQLEEIVTILNDCSYYVERNANSKTLFLDTSIRIHYILKQSQTAARATSA